MRWSSAALTCGPRSPRRAQQRARGHPGDRRTQLSATGPGLAFPAQPARRLIDRLREDGARAIGFDVVFADPPPTRHRTPPWPRRWAARWPQAFPVVLASSREKVDSASATLWTEVLPLQTLRDAGAQHGDAGVEPDDDFVVRRMPPSAGRFAATRAAPGRPPSARALRRRRPPGGLPGPRGSFDTRSYYQALEPGLLPAGYFRGKVVLVGRSALTASELQHSQADLFNAPFAALGGERLFPGVELQATLLDNHVTGAALRPVPEGWSLALVLLALAVLIPASVRWHPGTVAGLAAGLSGAVLLLSWWLFAQARLWLPPLLPLAAMLAIYGATALVAYATARQHARQVRACLRSMCPRSGPAPDCAARNCCAWAAKRAKSRCCSPTWRTSPPCRNNSAPSRRWRCSPATSTP